MSRRDFHGVFPYLVSPIEVSLPVMLYTNPNFQRSDLSLAVVERLSRIPNVRYIKDASSSTGRLLSIIDRVDGRCRSSRPRRTSRRA